MRFIPTIVSVFLSLGASAQCEKEVKDFYVSYMQYLDADNTVAADSLLRADMTPLCLDKVAEYTRQYDCDAVIHSQDVCRHAVETLEVVPMTEDWYLVKYKWSEDSRNDVMIPVRAQYVDGVFRITDISPLGTDSGGASYIKRK